MYQPYPTSGQGQMPESQRPPAPNSVQTAVKLMYAGAALSFIELILDLVSIGSVKSAIHKRFPNYTAAQLHTAEVSYVVFAVIASVIAIGLWLWMARANAAGRNWARITGTVFFALNTLFFLLSVARPHASIGLVLSLLVWLVGLGAVIMLWRKESAPYFTPRAQ
jgi:hypothetical protein